jgi:hypothetical protein
MLQFLLPVAALLAGSLLTVVLLALAELRGDVACDERASVGTEAVQ